MEIYYQGTEITNLVHTRKCIVRDTAGGRCDSVELEFDNAAGWYQWGPEEDDQIVVTHNGYDSGIMFVNTIIPENGRFRIVAAALPCAARAKTNRSFYQKSIEDIMRICAVSVGMDFSVFGIDGKVIIPYIEQDDEGCAAFLDRLLTAEGAALKCVNGRLTAIGIEYAQEQDAIQKIRLSAKQSGAQYRRCGTAYKGLTVKTPFACASAEDIAVPDSHMRLTVGNLPARDNVQAGRWARGTLLAMNRKCESLTAESDFNSRMTAMMRVDIEGDTDANGEWLVESAEHDLINNRTKATLLRCLYSVQ